MLDEAGWKPGADGIREKNGVKLRLKYSTTSGNKLREDSQVLAVEDLKAIGVDLFIENAPSWTFTTARPDVELVEPVNEASRPAPDAAVLVMFNMPMDMASVEAATKLAPADGAAVPITFTWRDNRAVDVTAAELMPPGVARRLNNAAAAAAVSAILSATSLAVDVIAAPSCASVTSMSVPTTDTLNAPAPAGSVYLTVMALPAMPGVFAVQVILSVPCAPVVSVAAALRLFLRVTDDFSAVRLARSPGSS